MDATQANLLRILCQRRSELIHDLRRAKTRETEIADELTETERAIADLERERLSDSDY